MTLLLTLFGRIGVPEHFRRMAAFAFLAGAALLALAVLKLRYDRSVVERHQSEVEAQSVEARDQAADERVSDAAGNAAQEKELHHAIDAAPKGGALSPAAHALACERLRKLGRIPAACRPRGGN